MPVVEAEDRMPIEPNRVYMIPPNKDLTVRDGALHLSTPVLHRGIRLPIDCLFHSLAQTQQEHAIGIILFRCYKKGTLMRRIGRRMSLSQFTDLGDYVQHLRAHPAEVSHLYKDLLIGVTEFFRETEAFDALATCLGKLIWKKADDAPIRIWVPGCSTGEEAYSLAILVNEQLDAAKKNAPVQIFATDIDDEALRTARNGVYRDSISVGVSPERLQRSFNKQGATYRVKKSIRDQVIFATQNLIADPPFSKMDLISCRNLLIYLEPTVQQKIIELFHFALADDSYLFLGSAETIGQHDDLFETVEKKSFTTTGRWNAISINPQAHRPMT